MIYGFLGKRAKGKIKMFVKRFFLLVSAKPLFPSKYNDEMILTEKQLPPWLDLDSLLFFSDETEYRPKRSLKMIECQELIIKNMQKSKETGFSFKINIGDLLIHLMSDLESDRVRWTEALK